MFEQRSNADLDTLSLKKIAHLAEEMIQLGLLEDQGLLLQEDALKKHVLLLAIRCHRPEPPVVGVALSDLDGVNAGGLFLSQYELDVQGAGLQTPRPSENHRHSRP